VRVGDRVEALTPAGRRVLEVVALGVRRGSADEARSLYVDHTPPPPPSELPRVLQRIAWRDPGAGRPTKRDGRAVRRLRGEEVDP
jgi:ribosome-associated heat shock protein Hsp15